jgi:hypothetical protein
MGQPASKRKKLDYPVETEGTRLAAKVRKLASKLTPDEEAEHFQGGLARIYATSRVFWRAARGMRSGGITGRTA